MIASSAAPQLLLDGELNVVAASAAFCSAFDIDCANIAGKSIFALGQGEWDVHRLQSLRGATACGDGEIEDEFIHEDAAYVLLLVGTSDFAKARNAAKRQNDLVGEKTVRLQEVQHRIANSMQIIASVILQSARRAKSDEARTSLRDAHNRVMSVAAIQQHLAASTLRNVEVRPYLTKLCQSIGASMIRDPKQLSLEVFADDGEVSADVSVGMGLITTELVINALKHAFPGHNRGTITVAYRPSGPNWVLSVSDNGVGMPTDLGSIKPGLGTNIVQALAKQLDAYIQITGNVPGTKISIVHV